MSPLSLSFFRVSEKFIPVTVVASACAPEGFFFFSGGAADYSPTNKLANFTSTLSPLAAFIGVLTDFPRTNAVD